MGESMVMAQSKIMGETKAKLLDVAERIGGN